MPIIFGRSLGQWLIQIVGAVLIFLLIVWLLPLLFAFLHIPVPDQVINVFALLCALIVLFGPLWWSPRSTA